MGSRLDRARDQLSAIACRVEALSPLAVLGRGYSITTRPFDGAVVRSAADVGVGDRILTRLHEGQIVSIVQQRSSQS
jgi:exodeoxyribonuclease VII large subunit